MGIVSTEEVQNNLGTVVKVSYSDNTKMYFHLLTDTTAEVVNYQWFYDSQTAFSPWVYRGDIVVPSRFQHQGRNYMVNCIGAGAFYQSVGWNQGYDYDINLISTEEIKVPQASVEAYRSSDGWKEFSNKIVGY